MIVDLMVKERNRGYHEENWKERTFSRVSSGKREGLFVTEGMGFCRQIDFEERRFWSAQWEVEGGGYKDTH